MFNLLPYADFAEGVIVGAGALTAVAVVYANRGRIASWFKRAEATVAAGVGQEITAIRQGLVNLENKASSAYASASSAITNVHNSAQAEVKVVHAKIDLLSSELSGRLMKLESAVFGADNVQAPADPAPSVTGAVSPASQSSAAPAQ